MAGLILWVLVRLFKGLFRFENKNPNTAPDSVRCPACNTENWAGYEACQKCGNALY
jgi:hypothetical protein